ncbi:Hypothetical_protein [Hexamita inflata]|uniref:Hypothetical_protein n=1 Tax=Hexamita inflata TaxID=28002 RepID=A0AA86QIW2_9EUKA|nr:Hypothetical protein HINF_LOCUS44742 [Hexamita inflata]CAI9957102.1 Hypothetical protein HINF_LOCUS44747 [Hexamita inflata]
MIQGEFWQLVFFGLIEYLEFGVDFKELVRFSSLLVLYCYYVVTNLKNDISVCTNNKKIQKPAIKVFTCIFSIVIDCYRLCDEIQYNHPFIENFTIIVFQKSSV